MCECSGRVRSAFRARGHDAWSCDILPADDGSPFHLREAWPSGLEDNRARWDLMIGHPPCTFLALCQIWRKHPSRADCERLGLDPGDTTWRLGQRQKAVEFFRKLWELPIPRICLENPMSIASTRVAPKSQTIHPWQFGHPEEKTTWLWLKNLPPLQPTKIVYREMMMLPRKDRERIHYMSPGPGRSSERDKTFLGVAEAMASQWG